MAIIPRHLLEVIAYAVLLAVLLYFLTTADTPAEALPVLSVYALAGFRLMPYLEIVYGGITRIRFNLSSLDQLYHDYFEGPSRPDDRLGGVVDRVPFEDSVELRDVHYAYPETQHDVLAGVDLTVRKGATIGLAGSSGSGRTTSVDLLLGLLSPRVGGLWVDGVRIDSARVRAWQRRLGYVPQHIYLTDGSITENIALGIAPAEVEDERIRDVARTARLDEFVESLPEGYATVVGERGVRLSGGQRQRIGIARALYHRPDLLILDEATNALDGVTEREVIDAIRFRETPSTVVIISHRLTALKDCDEIHFFENGGIALSGTFDLLLKESEVFRAMARADS